MFIHRSLKGCPTKAKEIALLQVVMEYYAPIWNKYLNKDISKLQYFWRKFVKELVVSLHLNTMQLETPTGNHCCRMANDVPD